MDAESIVELYKDRKQRAEPRLSTMRDFDAAYAGETTLPLPELSRSEKPIVANLIATGLDQTAMRVASTLPGPDFPPMRDTVDSAQKRAQQRHDVVLSWWHMNDLGLKLKERARHLLGYSTSPVWVGYDPACPYPVWKVLDPFCTFLPPPNPMREMTPLDAVHTYTQSLGWLNRIYPDHVSLLDKGRDPSPDDTYNCLQYFGPDDTVLVVLGRTIDPTNHDTWQSVSGAGRPWIEVDRQPNPTGLCPVVCPNRITLNRHKPAGQFDGLIGVFEWQARLMALGVIAAERDIFPDLWAISRPNENITIEEEADGLKGVIGKVSGGSLEMRHNTPGNQHLQLQSILERAIRLEGAVPSEFTGEAATNVRTARRGGQILSQAVDFAIQEAQQIFEVSLREENVRAIAADQAHYGSAPRAFYFDWKGRKGSGTYNPGEIWETDRHSVNYCVDDETEALTSTGWKRYNALVERDLLLTLNPDSSQSEWQPIEAVHVFPAEPREMILMSGQSHTSLTTPEHRWLVNKPRWSRPTRTTPARRIGTKTVFTTSAELKMHDSIPVAAPCADLPTEPKFTDALVEAVAWFWTEGSIRRDSGAVISQSQQINPLNVERIRAALTGIFGPPVAKMPLPRVGGQRGRRSTLDPCWRENLVEGKWTAHLSATAARLLQTHAPSRVPTFAFIRVLTLAQLHLFIERSLDADGWRAGAGKSQRALAQKNCAAAEAFQFACTLAGYATSLYPDWKPTGGRYPMWRVGLRSRTGLQPVRSSGRGQRFEIKRVCHDGIVWCPQTANGTWLARRHGTVWFTGNSMPGADLNELTVLTGQAIGIGLMSKERGMELHPLISDPLAERSRVAVEALDQAFLQGLQTAIATPGGFPITDLARLIEIVDDEHLPTWKAALRVQREAQERQATEGAPGEPTGPVAPESPEAQPGINPPGMGAEAATIAPPTPGTENLADLLSALR